MRTLKYVGPVAVALFASAVPATVLADQFVAMDETWVHGPDMPDSHYRVSPAVAAPANWDAYADGTAWVYLEVLSKPTDQETKFQVCFEATPTYACTNQSPTYTTAGTYEWETPFADFWSPPGTSVDWSLGVNKLACILKDTMNNKPSADNVGDETAALYMPTEVRMVVTIVEDGSTYVPPTPTQGGAGGSGGAGGKATSGDGEAGSATTTGGGASTSDSGGSGGAPGGDSVDKSATDDGGCSLARQPRESGVWGWALLGLLFGLTRLRRR